MYKLSSFLLVVLALSACYTASHPPADAPGVEVPTTPRVRHLGEVKIQFSANAQGNELHANALMPQATVGLGNPVLLSKGLIDKDGVRYLHATFQFANSTSTPIQNLHLYAQTNATTLAGTAISQLTNALNQTPQNATTLARQITPTHRMSDEAGVINVKQDEADFQAYSPSQVAAVQTPDLTGSGTTILDYGFAAKHATSKQRAIPTGSNAVVTFAVQFPFDPNAAASYPFGFTMSYQLIDESPSQTTRTLAEHTPGHKDNVCARAQALGTGTKVMVVGTSGTGPLAPICPHTVVGDLRIAAAQGTLKDLYLVSGTDQPASGPVGQPNLAFGPQELIYSGVKGSSSAPQSVTLNNTGSAALTVSSLTLTGPNAAAFSLVTPPATPFSIAPGGSVAVGVTFTPGSTTVGALAAALTVTSNTPTASVGLYGLSANGLEGSNEPTLDQVVKTLGFAINVGGTGLVLNPGDPGKFPLGDEVVMPLLEKAASGPVTLKPVARYAPNEVLPFGYYLPGGTPQHTVLASLASGQHQTLYPGLIATAPNGDSFDPGSAAFGVFVDSPFFNRKTYSQDTLNTGPLKHAVRFYPLKNRAGQAVANSYLVAFEDAANGDYQDYVFVITNVKPASAPATTPVAKVNFQTDAAPLPVGHLKDFGQPYSASRGYGWMALSGSGPIDLTLNTRLRTTPSDPRLNTLIIMQGSGAAAQPNSGLWEYSLANGRYEVTVGVGDDAFFDSSHRVVVEGVVALENFVPNDSNPFMSATVTVNVNDGRLTVAPTGGQNVKLTYLEINALETLPDTIAPTVAVNVAGTQDATGTYKSKATVSLSAADEGGSGLASVSYSLNGGATTPYSAPFEVSTSGNYTVSATATDGAGNTATASKSFTVAIPTPSNARITLENRDGVFNNVLQPGFFNDWLAMDRIAGGKSGGSDGNWDLIKNHEVATLRLKNTGTETLQITGFVFTNLPKPSNSNKWLSCSTATCFKLLGDETTLSIAPGAFYDLKVAFVEPGGSKGLRRSTLTIFSNDSTAPETVVQLAGGFMQKPEGNNEITEQNIADLMGYSLNMGAPLKHDDFNLKGDELRSPTWTRADGSKPIYVRQIAAYHGCCNAQDSFSLVPVNANGTNGSAFGGFTHHKDYGQSLFPRISNNINNFAHVQSSPAMGVVFEIRSANYSTKTSHNNNNGNLGVRLWPVKDRDGGVIANVYFVAQDFVQSGCGSGSANCDYNDNMYLISNIKLVHQSKLTWSNMAQQAFNNSEAQGITVGGKLYSFGGFDSTKSCCTPTARAYAYTPATDTWATIAAIPAFHNSTTHGGVTHAGITTDGQDIILAGGYTANANGTGQIFGTNHVWRYNVASNDYTRLPNLPVEISGGQLEYLNGKLHHFGGSNVARTIDLTTHYVFDYATFLTTGTGSWTTAAPLPSATGRHHMGSAVLDGKIYAIGGQKGHDGALVTQATVQSYNPATNSWSNHQNLPRARGHISNSTFVFNGRIVVAGGETAHTSGIADVVAFDPQTNSWAGMTSLPASRISGVAGAIDGAIYFTTGSSQKNTYKGVPVN